jgi:transposase-like protein
MALPKHGKKHVEAWQASGLTQAAYCRQAGLNAKNLSRWIREYRLTSESTAPRLIPIEIKPTEISAGVLQLRLPQGHTLELPSTVSPRWLGELLQCLG